MVKKTKEAASSAKARRKNDSGRDGKTTRSRRVTKKAVRRDDASLEGQLRRAVELVDVADMLSAPLTRSIENLLRLAAQSVGSDEASVLVRDGSEGGLRFLVAIGEVADKLKGVRLPPGKGIAGFVFASGQPMVVGDVAQEETFYREVDRATGYQTETLLTTPLRAGDEVIGVLQFVNRVGEPPYEPFTPEEMDRAAYFADAIGTLVEAYEVSGLIETMFARAVKDANVEDGAGSKAASPKGRGKRKEKEAGDLQTWLGEMRAAPEHQELMRLAVALQSVAARGEAERQLCREVIEALSRFVERRGAAGGADFQSFMF